MSIETLLNKKQYNESLTDPDNKIKFSEIHKPNYEEKQKKQVAKKRAAFEKKIKKSQGIKQLPTKATIVKDKQGAYVRNQHVRTDKDSKLENIHGHMGYIGKLIKNISNKDTPADIELIKQREKLDAETAALKQEIANIDHTKNDAETAAKITKLHQAQTAKVLETIPLQERGDKLLADKHKIVRDFIFDSDHNVELDIKTGRLDNIFNDSAAKERNELQEKRAQDGKANLPEILKMFKPDVLKNIEPLALIGGPDGRSYYTKKYEGFSDAEIVLLDGSKKTLAHEFGHHVETSLDIVNQSKAFLDRRCGDQKVVPVFSKQKDGKEITRPDNFIDPYVGKVYDGDATEVVSMGLQYMFSDPVAFYNKDPDHFKFIYGIIKGL